MVAGFVQPFGTVGGIAQQYPVDKQVAVPDFEAATSEINHAVLESFRERNIVIPLPQREVRMLATG